MSLPPNISPADANKSLSPISHLNAVVPVMRNSVRKTIQKWD